MLATLVPAVLFLLSTGVLFAERFRRNRALVFVLASIGILSSALLFHEVSVLVRSLAGELNAGSPSIVTPVIPDPVPRPVFVQPHQEPAPAPVAEAEPAPPGCSGGQRELSLGDAWMTISDGSCRVVFRVDSGEVVVGSASGEHSFSADDNFMISRFRLDGVTRVRALSVPARLTYALCPAHMVERNLGFDCKPAVP